jgi:hypothetical protein
MKVGGMFQFMDTIILICDMKGDQVRYWNFLDYKMVDIPAADLVSNPTFKWIGLRR